MKLSSRLYFYHNGILSGKLKLNALGPKESIKVNELQQTEIPNVWAAGDCAQSYHLVSRRPVYVALGTVANKQGRIAGMRNF